MDQGENYMAEFKLGQLIVILSLFTEVEIYGNVKFVSNESLTLTKKPPVF